MQLQNPPDEILTLKSTGLQFPEQALFKLPAVQVIQE